jgi:hypothetical protein
MSSQKIISGNGFNEAAAVLNTNNTGVFSSLSSDLTRSNAPAEEYRYSVDPTYIPVSGGIETLELVAGVGGRQIEVLNYSLIVDAASTVQIFSDSNPLSGPMAFAANGGITVNDNEPAYRTNVGEALQVSNSAGNIAGSLAYRIV